MIRERPYLRVSTCIESKVDTDRDEEVAELGVINVAY